MQLAATAVLLVLAVCVQTATSWSVSSFPRHAAARCPTPRLNFFEKLVREIDNFADDAVGRRLGVMILPLEPANLRC